LNKEEQKGDNFLDRRLLSPFRPRSWVITYYDLSTDF